MSNKTFFWKCHPRFNRLMSILLYTENHSKGAPVARVNELRPKDFTQRFQTLWSVNRRKSWTSAQRDIQQIFLRKQLLHLPLLLLYAKWAFGMWSSFSFFSGIWGALESFLKNWPVKLDKTQNYFLARNFAIKPMTHLSCCQKTARFWTTRENGQRADLYDIITLIL